MTDPTPDAPAPVVISRRFEAPPATVFKAWSDAHHVQRWFSPEQFTTTDARVDFRPGGVFEVCMRSPAGQDSWSWVLFTDVTPSERLAFSSDVTVEGDRKFT